MAVHFEQIIGLERAIKGLVKGSAGPGFKFQQTSAGEIECDIVHLHRSGHNEIFLVHNAVQLDKAIAGDGCTTVGGTNLHGLLGVDDGGIFAFINNVEAFVALFPGHRQEELVELAGEPVGPHSGEGEERRGRLRPVGPPAVSGGSAIPPVHRSAPLEMVSKFATGFGGLVQVRHRVDADVEEVRGICVDANTKFGFVRQHAVEEHEVGAG